MMVYEMFRKSERLIKRMQYILFDIYSYRKTTDFVAYKRGADHATHMRNLISPI